MRGVGVRALRNCAPLSSIVAASEQVKWAQFFAPKEPNAPSWESGPRRRKASSVTEMKEAREPA